MHFVHFMEVHLKVDEQERDIKKDPLLSFDVLAESSGLRRRVRIKTQT